MATLAFTVTNNPDARFEAFTTVKIEVQHWRWRQHDPPKQWYTTTTLHGAI